MAKKKRRATAIERLQEIARHLGYHQDWRVEPVIDEIKKYRQSVRELLDNCVWSPVAGKTPAHINRAIRLVQK